MKIPFVDNTIARINYISVPRFAFDVFSYVGWTETVNYTRNLLWIRLKEKFWTKV